MLQNAGSLVDVQVMEDDPHYAVARINADGKLE
jgi:hypothetical protein